MIIFIPFSTASLDIEKSINLWMTNIPADWKDTFSVKNNNLAALVSLLICKNWKGTIDVQILNNNPNLSFSEVDKEDLHTMIRFPKQTQIHLKEGDLLECVKNERNADVNIFNIEQNMQIEDMVKLVNQSRISAIFCADSEFENVLV